MRDACGSLVPSIHQGAAGLPIAPPSRLPFRRISVRGEVSFDSGASANYHPGTDMKAQSAPDHNRAAAPNHSTIMQLALFPVVLLLCAPLGISATMPRPHRQPKEVVHIIERLEQRWQQAELDANTSVMATMLSDDYLGIYSNGMLATKAETLANFKNGATRFTSLVTSDRKIRVFGSTAVVVSKAEVTGVNDGESVGGHYRYTRVYHRHNGVWKIVSFEASSVRRRKPDKKTPH